MVEYLKRLKMLALNETIFFKADIEKILVFRGLKNSTRETDTEILERYFSKDSVSTTEQGPRKRYKDWAYCFAGNPIWGVRIDPLTLDPFVARYVNAANRIGAKTLSSCDGWHEEKERSKVLFITFKERYSWIWHKLMFERLEDKYKIEWSYIDNAIVLKLPSTDEGKIRKYIAVNKVAEEFENHRSEMLDLKQKVINRLKGKTKNSLSDSEIETLLRATIKEIEQSN